jgi:hypothetical protein
MPRLANLEGLLEANVLPEQIVMLRDHRIGAPLDGDWAFDRLRSRRTLTARDTYQTADQEQPHRP